LGSALPGGKRTSALNISAATPLSAVDVARCGSSVALSAAPELRRSMGRSSAQAEDPRPQAVSAKARPQRIKTFRFMDFPLEYRHAPAWPLSGQAQTKSP
jgi:hypothetical protein